MYDVRHLAKAISMKLQHTHESSRCQLGQTSRVELKIPVR